ncbi:hypothetical protein ACOSQ2_013870 [Xanthoceras sorbifolium]
MLAKQSWRLVLFPNSLVARDLKSVYFPRGSFLEAGRGSKPSFVWRSLLWGRDLIELGFRWRIGDGTSTFVYKDRWIPRPSSFKVVSPIVLDPLLRVANLKNPSGGWDSNLVWSSFLPDDAKMILNLPCSSSIHPDSLLWHQDSKGNYSVKSGYWLTLNHKIFKHQASCSWVSTVSWWKVLWNLNIPSKLKVFCWKACHNWLPTFQTLNCRHLEVPVGCPCCGAETESTPHALWFCSNLYKLSGQYLYNLISIEKLGVNFFFF